MIEKGKIKNVDDAKTKEQFQILTRELSAGGFINYELSSFGKEGFFSKNNSSYWLGVAYLGIGPSAHSFDGKQRSWNVKNNAKYIKSIGENVLPIERETLSTADRYNEFVMIGLRTIWGVSLVKIKEDFGEKYLTYLKNQSKKHIEEALLYVEDGTLKTREKGRFLVDGIAADLFMLNE
jgi:oxygen-independent coproporphyrinogen-3 oxidase